MKGSPKPRRRWFRFSLRTMLVLVTLVCVYLGWAMNWIHERRAFLSQPGVNSFAVSIEKAASPRPLELLGEGGTEIILLDHNLPRVYLERAHRLFPESEVSYVGLPLESPPFLPAAQD
jgi:hypothetical protein